MRSTLSEVVLVIFQSDQRTPDPDDDIIVLGATVLEDWRVARPGVFEVARRGYFAMVICDEYEGLIRLDSAADRPPKRIKFNELVCLLFVRKQ